MGEAGNEKSLIGLAWPLMISFTLRSLLTSIDVVYAGQLSDTAVAAIGLFFPIEFVFIACWVGSSSALTSHLSKAIGEKSEGQLAQLLKTAGGMVAVLSVVFAALGGVLWWAAPHLGLAEGVAHDFRVYGATAMVGIACCAFWSVLPDSLIKAHHDTRSTMVAGLISGVGNVILNTVFVFVFEWGVFGIGLATGLARLGSLLYALYRARRLEAARRERWKTEPPPRKRYGKRPGYTAAGLYNRPLAALLALGIPSALTYTLMSTESFLVNWVLSRFEDSTAAIAAYAIYQRAIMLSLMPVIATGVAILPFVARMAGAGRYGEVRGQLKNAFFLAFGYVVLAVGPLTWFGADWVAATLSNGAQTRDMASFAIRYAVPLGALVSVPFILSRPVFEALQRGGPGLVMAFVRYVCLAAPLALLGAYVARSLGQDPFGGLIFGLLTGSGLVSVGFLAWLTRTLKVLGAESSERSGAGQ
ncbi:MAG: MATE family efflux transporter [Planctomycetes bacterium]|nr:MATE family efflux transporter [Planctomycetota bacterium]